MMGSYFKPLRRKLGVLTLVLACLFAGLWMRSDVRYDNISFAVLSSSFNLISRERAVQFVKSGPMPVRQWFVYRFSSTELQQAKSLMKWDEWYGYRLTVHRRFCGFELAMGTGEIRTEIRFTAFVIPYWSIVIPLTLLATWMLLIKPRVKKIEPTEPSIQSEREKAQWPSSDPHRVDDAEI